MNALSLYHAAVLDTQCTPAILSSALGTIVYANPAAQGLFNVGLKQLLGSSINTWLRSPSDLESLSFMMNKVIKDPGQPLKVDVCLRGNAETLQAVLSATESGLSDAIDNAPNDATGSATGSATINQAQSSDWPIVIELLNHAPALLAHAAQLREAQQGAQKELLRNLAHEIRNPLAGIRGAAQLLARQLDDPNQREYTDVIVAESSRLQALLDRLLSAQTATKTLSMHNVHEIIERVRSIVSAEYPNQIVWQRDYDVSLPEVALDEHQIVQVLLNLVRNAAQIMLESPSQIEFKGAQQTDIVNRQSDVFENKITLSTRSRRQVTLGALRHKLALELLVIDNGPGIAPQIMSQLFNPLLTQRAGGTGLGLHIAQSFVHQHGGVIEVQSQVGKTVFKILLPIVKLK